MRATCRRRRRATRISSQRECSAVTVDRPRPFSRRTARFRGVLRQNSRLSSWSNEHERALRRARKARRPPQARASARRIAPRPPPTTTARSSALGPWPPTPSGSRGGSVALERDRPRAPARAPRAPVTKRHRPGAAPLRPHLRASSGPPAPRAAGVDPRAARARRGRPMVRRVPPRQPRFVLQATQVMLPASQIGRRRAEKIHILYPLVRVPPLRRALTRAITSAWACGNQLQSRMSTIAPPGSRRPPTRRRPVSYAGSARRVGLPCRAPLGEQRLRQLPKTRVTSQYYSYTSTLVLVCSVKCVIGAGKYRPA